MPDDEPKRLEDMLWERREQRRREQQQHAAEHAEQHADVTPLDDERARRYAARALEAELATLAAANEGERNHALNTAAFNLAQLIAAGALDEQQTRDALTTTALRIGLAPAETARTIGSGFRAGSKQPRTVALSETKRHDGIVSTADAPFGNVESSESIAQSDTFQATDEPDEHDVDEFWHSRELLTHVHQAARARMTSPWAVLACVLARVVTATPHTVVLPPIVGGIASLNMFAGLVGASGSGKGAAMSVAAECFQLGTPIKQATPGSGEGIVDAYKRSTRDGVDWIDDRHAVLFNIAEIDTLTALGSRQGATLMPELRRAWSGESLGHHYRDKTKRIEVEAQQYRLCLIAGIQPERAKSLLDDADGGTPQRFIWASALDRDAPETPPSWPDPLRWHPPHFARTDLRDPLTGRIWMSVPSVAVDTITGARKARLRGDGDALDGHLLLAQLKIAAAFAISDTRLDISVDDWQLADLLTRKSNATRAGIVAALERDRTRRNRARAEGDAERAVIVDERQHDAARARVMRNVLRKLTGGPLSRRDLSQSIAGRDRGMLDPCLGDLLDTGQVSTFTSETGGTFYALA